MRNAKQPRYCPLCGSAAIRTEYDNRGNGGFSEWYFVECHLCDANGTVAVNQE